MTGVFRTSTSVLSREAARRRCFASAERRDVVEIAVQDQRRNPRDTPPTAAPAGRALRATATSGAPARPRSRCPSMRPRRTARTSRRGSPPAPARTSAGRWDTGVAGSPELGIVVAVDRQIERLRVEPGIAVRTVRGDRLRGEPEQRPRVARPRGAGGGRGCRATPPGRRSPTSEPGRARPRQHGHGSGTVPVRRCTNDRIAADAGDEPRDSGGRDPHGVGLSGRASGAAPARQPKRARAPPRMPGRKGRPVWVVAEARRPRPPRSDRWYSA